MSSNVFEIQANMLDVAANAKSSKDPQHVEYADILQDIFSRECSHEKSNADDIVNVTNITHYIGERRALKNFVARRPKCRVHAACFPISRFASHEQTILFPELVSVHEAMKKVNMYLAQPMTPEYFNRVRTEQPEDFPQEMDFTGMQRREMIQNAIFLDNLRIRVLRSSKTSKTRKVLVVETGS
jgi:hypothetical protein